MDCSHRQLHGALLDAQLLAEAYLALTSGQGEIGFDALAAESSAATVVALEPVAGAASVRPRVVVSVAELEAHAARLAQLRKKAGGGAVWDRFAAEAREESAEAAEAAIA